MNKEEYDKALYLAHHGIKGQKWGVRRYQNEDGSYKSGAEGRYDSDPKSSSGGGKSSKQEQIRSNVKSYQKEYNKASSMSDKADAQWRKADELRKSLGKTGIGRTIAAMRGKSEAAKAYNKQYEKASKMSDDADAQWTKAKEMYKGTGKTKIGRVLNNIKYDDQVEAKRAAKQKSKEEKEAKIREAVEEYQKAYDKASSMSDASDAAFSKAFDTRKSQGRNSKQYSKEYDKASSMGDAADAQWAKAKELRKKTGRTALGRTINNIKYRNS